MIYNFDDLEFKIMSIDRFIHKNGVFEIKARPFAALSFRMSGEGRFEIGDKSLVTKEGDVLFVPANLSYKVEYSFSESIVVHLERCNYFEAENISVENVSSVKPRYQHLLESWNGGYSVNKAKSIIYDIFESISDDKKIFSEDDSFAKCVEYIESHFCDVKFSVEDVCREEFISPSSLQRKFHRYFEMSPKQYLTKLRMNKALELLMSNKLSVRETALACGFADEKYFSRAFKNKYGYPPSRLHDHITV